MVVIGTLEWENVSLFSRLQIDTIVMFFNTDNHFQLQGALKGRLWVEFFNFLFFSSHLFLPPPPQKMKTFPPTLIPLMEQAWQVTFVDTAVINQCNNVSKEKRRYFFILLTTLHSCNYPTNSLNICRLLRGQTRYLEIDLQAEKGISFHFFFFLFYFSNNFSE